MKYNPNESEPLAYRIQAFCRRYGISRTTAYAEIAAGRLLARKIGSATVIMREDAERWAASLPTMKTGQSALATGALS